MADNNPITPDQFNKMFNTWAETMKLPTIGPMFAFSKEFGEYANEFINLGKTMAEMKANLDQYWSLINAAYVKASSETAAKAPKQFLTKEDFENYKKAMTEAFENAFTGLFSSAEFSKAYGKVFTNQLDITKEFQNIIERNSKALNLPTKSEIDEILKDVHDLKKRVRDLEKGNEGK